VVLLIVFMEESHSAMFDDHPQFPVHEESFQGGVVPNVQNGLGAVLDDSSGSRRNDRFFGGYPGFGYNSYYNDYPPVGGYGIHRSPFLDYNGLVRNFDRDCADSYPNRRYSCYGYGYGRK